MHNGTFPHITPSEEHSDTYLFAETMKATAKEYGSDMLYNESFLRRMEKEIHSYNKVIFLRNDGKVAIMNPSSWHHKDGIMMSNTYSLIKDYRKISLVSEYVSSAKAEMARPALADRPPVTQGGSSGKTPEWLAKSIAWEKAQKEKAERERARILNQEKSLDSSKKTATVKQLRKERKKIEKEIAARNALEIERSNRVVRRVRQSDGTYEHVPLTQRAAPPYETWSWSESPNISLK
jgi:hypothetical protein